MKHLRWLMLAVPVMVIVAASCATPPNPEEIGGALALLLTILPLVAGFAALAQSGGNGYFLCVTVFCQVF